MTLKRKAPRTVENGAGWHITYSPLDREYSAHIDGVGIIGYAPTKEAAHDIIQDTYCDVRAIAAAVELTANGMRRADATEPGWYVLTSAGKVWATDNFETARWA